MNLFLLDCKTKSYHMKQIKFFFLALTVCVLAFNSCKKSSTKPKVAAQSISLKFNGTSYTSSTLFASYGKSLNALQVVGTIGTTASVYLAIPLNFKVGTFDIASSQAAATFSNGANLQDTYMATSGSIVITSFTSTTVAGTFQFTGSDMSNVAGTVTSGQFTANYTSQ
jgi:hypothetical protein